MRYQRLEISYVRVKLKNKEGFIRKQRGYGEKTLLLLVKKVFEIQSTEFGYPKNYFKTSFSKCECKKKLLVVSLRISGNQYQSADGDC